MTKRYIILQKIGNSGNNGVVSISGDTVTVSIAGHGEEYNLYFMTSGSENSKINAGIIRGGFAKSYTLSQEDAKSIDTVVLLKGTEPVIYGSLAPGIPELCKKKEIAHKEEKEADNKLSPLGMDDGFMWLKIEDGRFAENIPIIRHIFENINVIGRINKYGFYMYGTKESKSAVAILSDNNEANPFVHLERCARYINGYWTVGADKKERYFYSLID